MSIGILTSKISKQKLATIGEYVKKLEPNSLVVVVEVVV